MKKSVKILIVIGVIVLAAGIFINTLIGRRNMLVGMDETVKAAWAQVENQLQRRFDLIPNLVATVKGYATHEKDLLENVTKARASVGQAKTVGEKINANNELSGFLSRLMVIQENYPNLKANQNFLALQDQLEGTENRLSVERRRYNEEARNFNAATRMFLNSFVVSIPVPIKVDCFTLPIL